MSNDPDSTSAENEMLSEYDFSGGIRGKHLSEFQRGQSVTVHKADGTTEQRDFALPDGTVILDRDVRHYFPDSDAVNRALRGLIELIPVDRSSHETQ